MRNIQVDRLLQVWRHDEKSYVSWLPKDILDFLNPYLEPEVWIDQLVWQLRAQYINGNTDRIHRIISLADDSLVVSFWTHLVYLPSQHQDFIQLTDITTYQQITADPQVGFWTYRRKRQDNLLRQYDPASRQYLRKIVLGEDLSWCDFAFCPDGSFYLISDLVVFHETQLNRIEHHNREGECLGQWESPSGQIVSVSSSHVTLQIGASTLCHFDLASGTGTQVEFPLGAFQAFGDSQDSFLLRSKQILRFVDQSVSFLPREALMAHRSRKGHFFLMGVEPKRRFYLYELK